MAEVRCRSMPHGAAADLVQRPPQASAVVATATAALTTQRCCGTN